MNKETALAQVGTALAELTAYDDFTLLTSTPPLCIGRRGNVYCLFDRWNSIGGLTRELAIEFAVDWLTNPPVSQIAYVEGGEWVEP